VNVNIPRGLGRSGVVDGDAPGREPLAAFAPTEGDATLLAFALSRDDRVERWTAWRSAHELDDVAGVTHELLPAVYKRLEELRHPDPDLGRLRGIYRYQWTRGQQHRAAANGAHEVLGRARVWHLRPWDLDAAARIEKPGVLLLTTPRITVPYERSGAAIEALSAAGWTVAPVPRASRSVRARLTQTEWNLEQPGGASLILANHYNPRLRDRAQERDVWRRSTPAGGYARDVAPSDLIFGALTDAIAHREALRWAVASFHLSTALETATGGPIDLGALLSARVARFLLGPVESRLAYLATIEPENATVAGALAAARAERARLDADRPAGRGARGAIGLLPHMAEASIRIVRRFGGPRGTWRYLRATR
jgi:hypothetical protein